MDEDAYDVDAFDEDSYEIFTDTEEPSTGGEVPIGGNPTDYFFKLRKRR